MYVTLSEVKNLYNICLPDARVVKSLHLAHDHFKRMVSVYEDVEARAEDKDRYILDLPFNRFLFDTNYDWKNGPEDVQVFEFNPEEYTSQEVSDRIVSVEDYKHGASHKLIVNFDTDIPTDSTLYPKVNFKLHLTPINLAEKRYAWFIKDYVSMYCLYNLLNSVDVSKLQTGVASWNLNGVTLSVDSSTIRSVLEDLKNKMDELYNEFMPIVSGFYQGNIDDPDRYFGYNSGFTSTSNGSFTALMDRWRRVR